MSTDNVIPFNRRNIRAEIETNFAIAVETFGEDNIKIIGIAASWGDTMDDEQVLAALRKLNQTSSMFDDVTDRATDDL
jgi:hypothetical protein